MSLLLIAFVDLAYYVGVNCSLELVATAKLATLLATILGYVTIQIFP